jgi:hypothetical protein
VTLSASGAGEYLIANELGVIVGDRRTRTRAAVGGDGRFADRSVMGEVPVAGFLTYGEIASYGGSVESWHNTTAVCVGLPE